MIEVIKQSLEGSKSGEEKLNRTREFLQVLILKILFDRGYFENIAFTGGTALRILYKVRRYSEDLDFSLVKKEKYDFGKISDSLLFELRKNGFKVEEKRRAVQTVNSVLLKFNGLYAKLGLSGQADEKFLVKLQVDSNPPKGGNTVVMPFTDRFVLAVKTFDLPSLFATKLHACFYRKYTKGRDFYDLVWYLGRRITPNIKLLNNAVFQTEKKDLNLTELNYKEFLSERVKKVDFSSVRKDVAVFLEDKNELKLLEKELILKMLES
ncbi:MAG: nucleotidyl transferase AbiEii/AbiGii toxin family protein [Candidatus Firestonebacteria bacterium]|nr:nucleotidyl transferase AbiEii/AbiGii toxin family protein [Candidatus Firestonebacteria bacterium]